MTRSRPNAKVLAWLRSLPTEEQFLSVLSVGEIRNGVERLDDLKRRERLRRWLERDLAERVADRLLPIRASVAARWGRVRPEGRRPVPTGGSLAAHSRRPPPCSPPPPCTTTCASPPASSAILRGIRGWWWSIRGSWERRRVHSGGSPACADATARQVAGVL